MVLKPDTEARVFYSLLLFCAVALVGGCIGIPFFGWLSIAIAAVVFVITMAATAVLLVAGL